MKESFLQRMKSIKRWMVSIFRRGQGSETATFLGFVLLALAFWFLQGLNDEVENSFEVAIELQNLPENAVLINELPTSIEIQIRDKGPAMLGYLMRGIAPIRIDFNEYAQDQNSFVLKPTQFKNIVQEALKPSTQILSMSHDTLRVVYTKNPGKQVKVVVKSAVTTLQQAVQSGEVTADVDSVLVYGDYKELDNIHEVYTEEIRETLLGDTLRKTVRIVDIPRVRIVPNQVTVTIPVEDMVSKTLDVPVVAKNLPANWRITILPSTVQLTCVMPFSKFAEVSDNSFVLGVSLPQLSQHSAKLGVEVLEAPAFVSNVTLSQDSVDYILIEQQMVQ